MKTKQRLFTPEDITWDEWHAITREEWDALPGEMKVDGARKDFICPYAYVEGTCFDKDGNVTFYKGLYPW